MVVLNLKVLSQKVHQKIETPVNLVWQGLLATTLTSASLLKNKLECRTFLLVKVNNTALTKLGYTKTLQPGDKLILSVLIDEKNFNAGGQKVYLGLELEVKCGFSLEVK